MLDTSKPDEDETELRLAATCPRTPLSVKARLLSDTIFVRYGTTIASEGEWALLLAVIEAAKAIT